jgi:pyruvate-formate lyase-activating enzyme
LVPGAEPERVIREIEEIIGLDCSNIIRASAKMGLGIEETLEAVVERIPPPKNTVKVRLQAFHGPGNAAIVPAAVASCFGFCWKPLLHQV